MSVRTDAPALPILARYRSRTRDVLPEGTLVVGIGLALAGVMTYGFLALTARALGPARYSSFSGFWAVLFLVAPAVFMAFEQQLGRMIAARRAAGAGYRSTMKRTLRVQIYVAAFLLLATLVLRPVLTAQLFDDQDLLLLAFVLGLGSYLGSHMVKGIASGSGSFGRYGIALAAEGLVRLTVCVALLASSVDRAWPYALAVAFAPLVTLFLFPPQAHGAGDDAPTDWGELTSALWHLFAGSAFSAALLNAGPVAMKALSESAEAVVVSQFLVTLVVARVPLFLFQAVQIAMLPKLAALAATGRAEDFSLRAVRLVVAVGVFGLVFAVGSASIGPSMIRLAFGEGFALGPFNFLAMGLSCTAFMTASAFAQAVIACDQHRAAAISWALGCVVMSLLLLVPIALVERVELAMAVGACAATAAMARSFLRARSSLRQQVELLLR